VLNDNVCDGTIRKKGLNKYGLLGLSGVSLFKKNMAALVFKVTSENSGTMLFGLTNTKWRSFVIMHKHHI